MAVISWDIIHPDYQGQGIGRKLTEYRINHIKSLKEDIDTIIVNTSQLTDKFYAKFGFEITKTEKDYWAKGIDLCHMVMRIK